jgi:hypothetical protein
VNPQLELWVSPWEANRKLDETRDKWNALYWWSEGRGTVPYQDVPKDLRNRIVEGRGKFRSDIYKPLQETISLKPLSSKWVILDPVAYFKTVFATFWDDLEENIELYNELLAESEKVSKKNKRPIPKEAKDPIEIDPLFPDMPRFGWGMVAGAGLAIAALFYLMGDRIFPRRKQTEGLGYYRKPSKVRQRTRKRVRRRLMRR